jgi:predicted DCC family thiol-disulfide oxidoreductase YuxK
MVPMPSARLPVLLYDGDCRLCNGVVRFMLRHDTRGVLRFAPLQSPPGQDFLRSRGLPTNDFDSLIFVPDWDAREKGPFLSRTAGALAAFAEIGGPWRALARLRIVPAWLRDGVYRIISRTRYALFGSYRHQPLPNPEWEKRFLAL